MKQEKQGRNGVQRRQAGEITTRAGNSLFSWVHKVPESPVVNAALWVAFKARLLVKG